MQRLALSQNGGWKRRLKMEALLELASCPHQNVLIRAGISPGHGTEEADVLQPAAAYQKRRDMERKAALDRIAKEAFESGLYDRTGMPESGEDE